MKSLLTIASLFAISLGINAQTTGQWTLLESKNGVNIYEKEEICTHEVGTKLKNKILKFENTTASVKNVSFRIGAYYGTSDCATCSNEEYNRKFAIAPNASVEGGCNQTGRDHLNVFIRYENEKNYNPDLSKIELQNLQVK